MLAPLSVRIAGKTCAFVVVLLIAACGSGADGDDGRAADAPAELTSDVSSEAAADGTTVPEASAEVLADASDAQEAASPDALADATLPDQATPEAVDDADAPPPLDVPAESGGGPKACETDADCSGAGKCPPDAAKGCTCATDKDGDKVCRPACDTDADCPTPPDKTLVCTDGICEPEGGGDPTPGGDGMTTETTVSDQAQSMTIAFDGLAFVTGTFCAQTFYPPGKVADFFGFQYLRDNDPTNMGHNTEFTTLTADPVLLMLNDAQLDTLAALGDVDQPLGDQYGLARFPLARAFRRLFDGDTPAGHPALDLAAVKAYSAWLFGLDGQMSLLRAEAYASVLGSLTAEQKATLNLVKEGAASEGWMALQPSDPSDVQAVMQAHPTKGDLRTYAGEMLAWHVGGTDPDVYFCPERQGTYFGSFFMKDVKAMHNPNTTIDSNMTADMGDFFLNALDATTQRPKVEGLVEAQKADLYDIVAKRTVLSNRLRAFLADGAANPADILSLSYEYGALDGALSALYATAFSSLELTDQQKTSLMAERKKATAEDDGSADYDTLCGNGYLYSAPLQAPPTVRNTDFLFGVCSAGSAACTDDWDCCSFSCVNHACAAPFAFTSNAFDDGGDLPIQYTCDGAAGMQSPSPPLAWSGAPAGTAEYALTFTTLALDGTKYNWVLFHIPAGTLSLAEGTTVGTDGVSTDGPDLRYYPPCSTGPGEKLYTFTLYALSAAPTFGVPEAQVTGPVLEAALAPLTLATRHLDVTYTRVGL